MGASLLLVLIFFVVWRTARGSASTIPLPVRGSPNQIIPMEPGPKTTEGHIADSPSPARGDTAHLGASDQSVGKKSALQQRLAAVTDLQVGDHEHMRTIETVLAEMMSHTNEKEGRGHKEKERKFGERLERFQPQHVMHSSPLSIFSRVVEPCDPATVPFDNATAQALCTEFLTVVIGAAVGGGGRFLAHSDRYVVTLKDALPYRWRFRDGLSPGSASPEYDRTFVVHLQPLLPKFEQRTIKFAATISTLDVADWEAEKEALGEPLGYEEAKHPRKRGGKRQAQAQDDDGGRGLLRGGQIGCIIKVPQSLFPREPFSEVMALHLDRKLGINRVPPTAIAFLPAEFLVNVSRFRRQVDVVMDDMLLRESGVKDYDSWIASDFGGFVKRSAGGGAGGRSVGNGTHIWASVQLRLLEVRPSLDTMLQLPYSKKNPGWHRWLSPDFNDLKLTEPAVLELSQLAMFDFLTANDDRSPNKNNFVVGGCKSCPGYLRRPSGMHPTFVHLDQGMSLYENVPVLSHNPIGKTPKKVKFCIFYKPLMRTIRDVLLLHSGHEESTVSISEWVEAAVPAFVLRNVGSNGVGSALGKRMWALAKRLVHCLDEFKGNGSGVVLRPA